MCISTGFISHKTVCIVQATTFFTKLHCCSTVYLQHGSGNYFRPKDVTDFPIFIPLSSYNGVPPLNTSFNTSATFMRLKPLFSALVQPHRTAGNCEYISLRPRRYCIDRNLNASLSRPSARQPQPSSDKNIQ